MEKDRKSGRGRGRRYGKTWRKRGRVRGGEGERTERVKRNVTCTMCM